MQTMIKLCSNASLFLLLSTLSFIACGGVEPDAPSEALSKRADETLGKRASNIVSGTLYSGDPQVGLLLTQARPGAGVSICTATLAGARTAVTVAHCVEPAGQHLLILDDVRYNVDAVVRHPDYRDGQFDYDVAIVKLASAPNLTPAPLGVDPPTVGQQITLIGYGATGQNSGGSGTKRIAQNTVFSINTRRFAYRGASNGEGNVCFGDSGGPTFALINGERVVVGIHSFIVGSCGFQGNDMRVDAFLGWFKQTSNGDIVEGGKPVPPPVVVSPPLLVDGASCAEDDECASGLCAGDPLSGARTCGARCFVGDGSCGAGLLCRDSDRGPSACLPPAPQGGAGADLGSLDGASDNAGGCTLASDDPALTGAVLLLYLLVLGLLVTRRRR